jgi:DNA-binding transcriptional MocR family regulator
MSIKVMSKVLETEVVSDHTELLLLLAMADFADDDGACFPSVRKLAKKSRISDRQAHRVIKQLCDRKYIELVEKGGVRKGKNVSNRYRILVTGENVKGAGTDAMSPRGTDTATPRTDTTLPPRGDAIMSPGG